MTAIAVDTRYWPGRDPVTGVCGSCGARRNDGEPHSDRCCRYELVTDRAPASGFVHQASEDDLLADLHYNGVHVRCRPAKRWVGGNGHHHQCAVAGTVEGRHGHDHDGPLLCGCADGPTEVRP